MIKIAIAFIGLVLLCPGISSAQSPQTCPAGAPSPDGSAIRPVPPGQTSCILHAAHGDQWKYQGDMLYRNYGNGFNASGHYAQLQINSGGNSFALGVCYAGFPLWLQMTGGGFMQAIDPAHPLPSLPFWNATQNRPYRTFHQMMLSGQITNGDTLEVKPLVSGIPVWFDAGRVQNNNLTISIDAGAILGCNVDEDNAVIPVSNAVSGLTVTGSGEIAYAIDKSHGQYRGINLGTATGFTLKGTDSAHHIYIHDNDFGLQSRGDNGTVTISHADFDHNGSGQNEAATHNIYLGWGGNKSDKSTYIVSDTRSVCTNHGGFEFKSRFPSGTVQNSVLASPSNHGYTDCTESAAVDLSCGGSHTLGGMGPGTGVVLELGPDAQNNTIIRYGAEIGTPNCPAGGWSGSLVVQNAWLICDFAGAKVGYNPHGLRFTVKNSKIVGCFGGLGWNVKDGGTNTVYATRAAAGLGPYPALPAPP